MLHASRADLHLPFSTINYAATLKAQTRFPTTQYGPENQTVVNELFSLVDGWIASVDEYETYHYTDVQPPVPTQLAALQNRGVVTVSGLGANVGFVGYEVVI
jgi:hypothetical protein